MEPPIELLGVLGYIFIFVSESSLVDRHLQEDVLMLADPKGLQYVLQTSGYRYPKTRVVDTTNWLLMGNGIIWASGESINRNVHVQDLRDLSTR
jgi:hypothetical protein